jgi:two-component system, sensor histidine kinase and response regulator
MLTPAVILNVDDNEPHRYVRDRILIDAGFTAYSAATGQQALDMAALHHPDLILLDINLPDIDGIEVCRRLKSAPENASLLILQISASATTAPHATEALNNGADAYLAEPVDSTVLIANINALLRLRRAERQVQEANTALHQANANLASLNKDLRQSNQDLQQFAYFASHDLQEPLRQVTNFVQLISQTAAHRLTDEEQKFLNFVVEGAERMEHLIRALLSYSQLGHSERLVAASVDLNAVTDRVITDLGDRITEAGATISVSPLPSVIGDAVQIADVFQNLIVNAIKYRRPDQPLEIEIRGAEESPEEVRISVRDNGQGIDPAYHELIFLPFKRLHGREIPGTGIGLAICRRIVEAHGGRLGILSTVGEGTVFHFSLATRGRGETASPSCSAQSSGGSQ